MNRRQVRGSWRWVGFIGACAAFIAACASIAQEKTNPSPTAEAAPPASASRTEVELARKAIGPEGGSVSGGAATIDVPPGALADNQTVIIKEVNAESVTLPASTPVASKVYTLLPDDITFLKPVTVRFALDSANVSGAGAIVLLRSPSRQNQWSSRGVALVTASAVSTETDHFSDWATAAAPANSCFMGCVNVDAGPSVFECRPPFSGPGVHCSGIANGQGVCACESSTTVLSTTIEMPPPPSFLSALAELCGAKCPTPAEPDAGFDPHCTVETLQIEDWITPPMDAGLGDGGSMPHQGTQHQYYLSNADTHLSCSFWDTETMASCECIELNLPSFTIPAPTGALSAGQLVSAWQAHCGGSCTPPTGPLWQTHCPECDGGP